WWFFGCYWRRRLGSHCNFQSDTSGQYSQGHNWNCQYCGIFCNLLQCGHPYLFYRDKQLANYLGTYRGWNLGSTFRGLYNQENSGQNNDGHRGYPDSTYFWLFNFKNNPLK